MEERAVQKIRKSNRFIFYVSMFLVTFIVLQVLTIVDKGHGLMHSSWEAVTSASLQNLYILGRSLEPVDSSAGHESLRRLAAGCIPNSGVGDVKVDHTLTESQVSCLKEVLPAAAAAAKLENNSSDSADQTPDVTTTTSTNDDLIEKVNQEVEALRMELQVVGERLSRSVQMMPLKDLRVPGLTRENRTWFMSSVQGEVVDGRPEEFRFPSNESQGRILCLQGNHTSNGTMNKYGLTWRNYLPPGATYLPGLTFVADNYWDYGNPWHSMTALVNFAAWRAEHGCKVPDRIVTYHWGEVVNRWGDWVSNILHASFSVRLTPESMSSYVSAPVCFEDAVVHRRGLGGMSRPRMNALFDMVRCKVYKYCKIIPRSVFLNNKDGKIDITLLARTGAREFSNLPLVVSAISDQCKLVNGCQLHVVHISNLSFCEQVEAMSKTDVLVTSHGAQLTNMMFMPKGGSVMEMYPKGWLEFAGVGQYIYSWLADWTELHHEGTWRDPDGPECPYNPTTETLRCFFVFKDRPVGVNVTHLSAWTGQVLQNVQARRQTGTRVLQTDCPCDSVGNLREL